MLLPALLSWGERAQAVVTRWRTGPKGSRETLLSVAGGTNPNGEGREALVPDTVSPAALPLRWVPPPMAPAGQHAEGPRDEKDPAAGENLGLPRTLVAPTQAEGPRGHTLWSCDWLSRSELDLSQKTDPREGDHDSWPSAR